MKRPLEQQSIFHCSYCLGCLEGKWPGKDREPAQHCLFLVRQKIVAPIDGRLQRLNGVSVLPSHYLSVTECDPEEVLGSH